MAYDPVLVALSYAVAVIASLTALDLAGRVRASRGYARRLWLIGGAFSMGVGIWSMHFIGMLAMKMPMEIRYDIDLTIVSLVTAILASMLALAIVQAERLNRLRLVLGGGLMGGGICSMHYLGMEAMLMEGAIVYDPGLFVLSVAVAVLASIAALWLAFHLNSHVDGAQSPIWQRGLGAAVMGMAVAGMHYTGMAAAELPEHAMDMAMGAGIASSGRLAGMIAFFSIGIMLAALMMSIYDAHLSSKTALLAASLKKANGELKAMVSQDPLTKLPNRLLLEEHLAELLREATPNRLQFSVLFVDLDRFKTINDTLGHHVGDELIKRVAERLQVAVRDSDMVARVGGDEFMIVTSIATGRKESLQIAQRIVSSLGKAFQIGDHITHITTSIGISIYPIHGKDTHELMVHSDAAMYHAKDNGRDNYQVYEPGMASVAEKRARLESRLRKAIEGDRLLLAYQPKVDIATDEITGVEALLRWYDEELGQVSPDEIIPIAEDTGLILPIGEWVLRTACRQAKAWHAQGYPLLPIAVNLSPVQLNHRNFYHVVEAVLEETGFPPEHLELEITESTIMQDPDRSLKILMKLRELGIGLSIDDFGTGYSNLTQLKCLPINRLKIDRSFMSGVGSSTQDAAIVRAVIAMAHSLSLDIVAEGVETEEQLAFIRDLKGQQYQGHLCSKAIYAHEFLNFLDAHAPIRRQALDGNGQPGGDDDHDRCRPTLPFGLSPGSTA